MSDQWGGLHNVPSYSKRLIGADYVPYYEYHRDFLKTLQVARSGGCTRWGLKAPSHLQTMEPLFQVHPDAWAIRIHRDPLKSLPSTVSLMGTLKHMRCDGFDESAIKHMAVGNAYMFRREIEQRADGRLPDDRFIDVRYHDLMADPSGTIRRIYERTGWELSAEVADSIDRYVRERPRGKRGSHQYTLESMGFDRDEERERFHFYCEHYEIPEED